MMTDCPICIHGVRDEVERMLDEVGVTGPALAAVHEILVPCEPDERCIDGIREAVARAGEKLAEALYPGRRGAAAASAALLAALSRLDDDPLDLVTAEVCDMCAGRCHRRGPGGKMWRKAMLRVSDALIGVTDGRALFLRACLNADGPVLEVTGGPDDGRGEGRGRSPDFTLAPAEAARFPHVSSRLLRLCQLAIAKKVGRKVASGGAGKSPLKIRGLRVRGDVEAWSALHNAILDRGHESDSFFQRSGP